MKNILKKEDGVLIVEATYVFPIMFLIIFLMIYAGNAYLQKCKVESIVTQEVLKGAAYCGDPVTYAIEENGKVPGFMEIDVQPYRFWLGGMNQYEVEIQDNIEKHIEGLGGGLFTNMKPDSVKITGPTFNNAFIYATFSADVEYNITLPIQIFGEAPMIMRFKTHVDVPVTDSVELIRNVDMVEDYMQRSKFIQDGMEKITNLVNKAKSWLE